jgi:hypothetical protein
MSRDRGWRGFESVPTGRSRRSSAILYAREGGAGGWLVSTVRTTASGVCGTMGVRIGLFMVSYRVVGPCTGQFDWSVAEHGRCRGGNGGGWGYRQHEGNCTVCRSTHVHRQLRGKNSRGLRSLIGRGRGALRKWAPAGPNFFPFLFPFSSSSLLSFFLLVSFFTKGVALSDRSHKLLFGAA